MLPLRSAWPTGASSAYLRPAPFLPADNMRAEAGYAVGIHFLNSGYVLHFLMLKTR